MVLRIQLREYLGKGSIVDRDGPRVKVFDYLVEVGILDSAECLTGYHFFKTRDCIFYVLGVFFLLDAQAVFQQSIEQRSHLARLPTIVDAHVQLRALQQPNRPKALQNTVVDHFVGRHGTVHESHILLKSLHQQRRALIQDDCWLFSARIHHLCTTLEVVKDQLSALSCREEPSAAPSQIVSFLRAKRVPLDFIGWAENDLKVVFLYRLESCEFHERKSVKVGLYCDHPLQKVAFFE